MSAFIPDPGTLFYTTVRPRYQQVVEGDFTATKVRSITNEDRSYREDIFRCAARDGTHVVAIRLTGGLRGDKPYLFRSSDYIFEPVGPAVARAMGIDIDCNPESD